MKPELFQGGLKTLHLCRPLLQCNKKQKRSSYSLKMDILSKVVPIN